MKKLLLGCLGVTLVLMVVGGVLGYLYVVRPASEYLSTLREIGALRELDTQVLNRDPFEPPATGELSPEIVERFAGVKRSVQGAFGTQYKRFRERCADLEAGARSPGEIGTRELVEVYRDLSRAVGEAKRAQIRALNDAGLSLAEYRWVERQMYEAAGILVSSLDFEALPQKLAEGVQIVPGERPDLGPVPERNKQLVQPYVDTLQEWLPLAWVGM
jgi:hypothetical protein